jgi:hypothetical protein
VMFIFTAAWLEPSPRHRARRLGSNGPHRFAVNASISQVFGYMGKVSCHGRGSQ